MRSFPNLDTSILVLYLSAPPLSLSAQEYGAYKTFRSVISLVTYVAMGLVQKWKISSWIYAAYGIISCAGIQLVWAFSDSKGKRNLKKKSETTFYTTTFIIFGTTGKYPLGKKV